MPAGRAYCSRRSHGISCWLGSFLNFMRVLHLSRFITSIAVPVVMFPLIFWLQIELGHEIGLFPLYMLPVAKMSWEFGWRGALFSVLLASVLWLFASKYSGLEFSSEWLRYYNSGIRGMVFLFAAVFVLLFKRVVQQHMRRMEAMRALLNVCHGCGAVQGSDGRWIPFEELLNQHRSKQSCECPKCTAAHSRAEPAAPVSK